MRNFFERNQIIFQAFSSIVIGVMGIIISIVGLDINKKANEFSELQVLIADSANLPIFNSTVSYKTSVSNEDIYDDNFKITITNSGGNISNANMYVYPIVYISVNSSEIFNITSAYLYIENIYNERSDLCIEGKKVLFEKNSSVYQSDTKSFEFESNPIPLKLAMDLHDVMKEQNTKYFTGYDIWLIIEIQYIDYKTEKHSEWYRLGTDNNLIPLKNSDDFSSIVDVIKNKGVSEQEYLDKLPSFAEFILDDAKKREK